MIQALQYDAPVLEPVDVLVCGGGPAGIGAAVAAARQGVRAMLIESQGCLGGAATNALVGVWLGSYSRDGAYPVIGGIFRELVARLAAEGGAIPADQTGAGSRFMGYAAWHTAPIPFEFEACKRLCDQLVLEAGVRVRYMTTFIAPKLDAGQIEGVYVHSKQGLEFIPARLIVDATGDADVAARAGCPTIKGREEDGLLSPTSLIFVVEDVEYQAFEQYCRTTGDVRLRQIVHNIRRRADWPFPFEIMIALETMHRGRYFINTLRQTGIDGTQVEDVTRGLIEGRQQAHRLFRLMQQFVPGFAKARLVQTAPVLGIRETRRIVGDYQVTTDDLIQGRQFDDTIALSGYQWDMADPKRPSVQRMEGTQTARPYAEIPYRCLLPQQVTNLIVAGRCLSTDWDAMGPLRIMPACFAMGQAAGTAAALALEQHQDFRQVDVPLLLQNLLRQGAIL
jgi:hypothetical protein